MRMSMRERRKEMEDIGQRDAKGRA